MKVLKIYFKSNIVSILHFENIKNQIIPIDFFKKILLKIHDLYNVVLKGQNTGLSQFIWGKHYDFLLEEQKNNCIIIMNSDMYMGILHANNFLF